ncbi:transaldolase family protein [Candidatus Karelsulcia muelleri]|uniref:Translaldolase n=1 Tax=Candidatus Karelsulcia muelleri PSPU TaxID=1189303 RepID=A0AAD1AZD2_9FLAO|nr:transaldolase family protein [Candidatus Karelsulcia muelleri]NJJ98643.1 fructose-6-phosphate aldolase [Candidatus Karelsulcia muelleri]BAO66301.1 translaldolase [Candidatus Karelsulcia muelleri PSPU]
MYYFINTANLAKIKEAENLGILDGVNTNTSLIVKEGIIKKNDRYSHYKNICNIISGDLNADVISTDYNDIIKEGEFLSNLDKKIIVKVPLTRDGIKAIKYFSIKKIKTNCTLVFSTGQALLAAKAGANYISIFIGRLYNTNIIKEIKLIYDNYFFKTKILVTSIINTFHIISCAKIGIDIITAPLNEIKLLLNN